MIETGCLGVCPKHGVTALNATLPGTIHVIPVGAAPDAALDVLLGGLDPVVNKRMIETA